MMANDAHGELNAVWPWEKQHSTSRRLCTSKLDFGLRKKLVIWSIALYGAETWKILKCGPGDGWRRSVGPIV
jgi:hypothetical protein